MLKKRRYLFAALLLLLAALLAALLLLHAGSGADAEPGASGVSFVWAEVRDGR